jgi:Flp pilus assembly protein TadG
MVKKKLRKLRSDESGTVLVESAVSLLMFLVMLFGIVEAGRFMSFQQTLTDAAREGARLAVAPLTQTSTMATDAQIQAQAGIFLNSNHVTGATVTVTRPVAITANGINMQYTEVTVQAPYQPVTLSMFSALSVTLEGRSLMRNETSP